MRGYKKKAYSKQIIENIIRKTDRIFKKIEEFEKMVKWSVKDL